MLPLFLALGCSSGSSPTPDAGPVPDAAPADAGTDAPTTMDGGPMPGMDGGVDADADPLHGSWTSVQKYSGPSMQTESITLNFQPGQMVTRTYGVNYPPNTGAPTQGCVIAFNMQGTYTVAGSQLTTTYTSGTGVISGCTNASYNRPPGPLMGSDLNGESAMFSISGNMLMFNGKTYTKN
jgi:hypothetical protein